jgi:hypothetical protein
MTLDVYGHLFLDATDKAVLALDAAYDEGIEPDVINAQFGKSA